MLAAGDRISFSAVARQAGVSTCSPTPPGVRGQIDTAIAQQADDGHPRTSTGIRRRIAN
jgi:hypothetical protein